MFYSNTARPFSLLCPFALLLATALACYGDKPKQGAVSEHGWTSPWLTSGPGGKKEHAITQKQIRATGEMAVATTGGIGIVRHFPDVKSGILKIEFRVRFEYPTAEVNHPKSSVLKVYIWDKDRHRSFVLRWHTPYAWPEIGGNTIPRFYVTDANCRKRKGLEYTDLLALPHKWHKVATVLELDKKTYQLWVDDVKFDTQRNLGRGDLAWTARPPKLSAFTLSSRSGGIWFDAFRIWHDNKLIAATDFNAADGYVAGKSIFDIPLKSKAIPAGKEAKAGKKK